MMMNFDGSIVPEVADFGYSSIFTDSDANITVARTVPWHAPEVAKRRNGYTPIDAIRTDIYSFGLLCLWVCFRDELAKESDLTSDFADDHDDHGGNPASLFNAINGQKDRDELRDIADRLVRSLDLESRYRDCLATLFKLTLSSDPMGRTSSFELLYECFTNALPDQLNSQAQSLNVAERDLLVHGKHYEFEACLAPMFRSIH